MKTDTSQTMADNVVEIDLRTRQSEQLVSSNEHFEIETNGGVTNQATTIDLDDISDDDGDRFDKVLTNSKEKAFQHIMLPIPHRNFHMQIYPKYHDYQAMEHRPIVTSTMNWSLLVNRRI